MVSPGKLRELQTHLERLRPDQQDRVVDFARQLAQPSNGGAPAGQLEDLFGILPDEDAEEMRRIIEAEFEQADPDA